MRVKYRKSYQCSGNCCIHTRKATDLIFKNIISAKVTLEKHFVILSQNPMCNRLIPITFFNFLNTDLQVNLRSMMALCVKKALRASRLIRARLELESKAARV